MRTAGRAHRGRSRSCPRRVLALLVLVAIPMPPTTHEAYDTLKERDVVSADNEQLGTIAAIFHPKQAMPEARGGHFGHLERGLPWHVYAPIRTLTSDGAPGPLAASAP